MSGSLPPDSYFTLSSTTEAEAKIKRSRFIALSGPAENEKAAKEFLGNVRKKYHDARHVCHGWKFGLPDNVIEKGNDDGEPSGTGGEPILNAIRRSSLTDVVVAVVRYYGGIKLGTGGLGRAYGGTADQVLAIAHRREVLLGKEYSLQFPYAQQKTLQHLLENFRGRTLQEDYGAEVSWRLWLPHSTSSNFLKELTEISAGKLIPTLLSVGPRET